MNVTPEVMANILAIQEYLLIMGYDKTRIEITSTRFWEETAETIKVSRFDSKKKDQFLKKVERWPSPTGATR